MAPGRPDLSLLLGLLCTLAAEAATASARERAAPLVATAQGEVRGRWVEAERGGAVFAAYLGIPYARPPVDDLRFKSPKPAIPWQGALDASKDPPVCPQIDIHSANKEVIGQEDCLYLNVYVPEEYDPAEKLPVLVLVHGGAYEHGSGRMDAFGPHFLVAHRVILVSINYRLGVLGFISLDTEEVPGNAGLKDLAVALKWVRANIGAFGGDPGRVTAMGWSTGASAVHLLSLLPATQDLFSRAVLISGTAISARAYTERHVERAVALAAILGAADNTSTASTLRGAAVADLLKASDQPRIRSLGLPLPSPERRAGAGGAEPKLLEQDPESLLRQPKVAAIPTLLGTAVREGSFPHHIWGLASRPPAAVDELLPRFMPADLLPGADTTAMLGAAGGGAGPGPLSRDAAIRVAQLVRDEYSGGGSIANNTDTLLEFLGDAFIYASTWRAIAFMSNSSSAPLYLYSFQVDDEYNYVKKLYGIPFPGSSHVDELGYLGRFDRQPQLQQQATGTGTAPQTLLRITKMVTDFVKGLPPHSDLPEVPQGGAGPDSWPVLTIGPGTRLAVKHAEDHHYAFWTSLYFDLRSRTSSIRGRSRD